MPLPLGEDVAARIHRLESHAYRCTLEALYASGPLSWEQEALLTNLRITLHITNDEHLMELRNLISGPMLEACMPCFQRSKDDAGVYLLSLGIINGALAAFNALQNETVDFIPGVLGLSTHPVIWKPKKNPDMEGS